jgi:hypothetical protein
LWHIRFQNVPRISLDYGAVAKIYHQSHGEKSNIFFPVFSEELVSDFVTKSAFTKNF